MKTLYLILLTFAFSLTLSAQEISEDKVDEKMVLVIDFHSESKKFENVKVLFNPKTAATLADKVRKFGDKVLSWSEKAIKNDVSKYRKPIPGTINYDHLMFDYDGNTNTSEDFFMVPAFDVDTEGNCYLLLRGYYEGANITALRNSRVAGDKTRYQEECAFNFYVRINYKDINSWVNKVGRMADQVAMDQQKLKETKKLFR